MTFSSELTGGQEVPPLEGIGSGSIHLTIDDAAKTLCGTIDYQDLSGPPTTASLQLGEPGTTGAPFINLSVGTSPVNVNLRNLSPAQITNITTKAFYANVRTAKNLNGEIRGGMLEAQIEQSCNGTAVDAQEGDSTLDGGARDAGSSGSSGASGSSSSSGSDAPKKQGCSVTGAASGSSFALVVGVGLALSALSRRRKA